MMCFEFSSGNTVAMMNDETSLNLTHKSILTVSFGTSKPNMWDFDISIWAYSRSKHKDFAGWVWGRMLESSMKGIALSFW